MEERTTEIKIERRVPTIREKYWSEGGRGDGQGDVEKEDHLSYRRPYTMGNDRGKKKKTQLIISLKVAIRVKCVWSTGLQAELARFPFRHAEVKQFFVEEGFKQLQEPWFRRSPGIGVGVSPGQYHVVLLAKTHVSRLQVCHRCVCRPLIQHPATIWGKARAASGILLQ